MQQSGAPQRAHIHQHAFGCQKFVELCPGYSHLTSQALKNSMPLIQPCSYMREGERKCRIYPSGVVKTIRYSLSHLEVLWCNGYRCRKWTRQHEFKSWTRLIAFHIALIPLGKVWIQLFSLQLWLNSRTDWVLQPWWGNKSRRWKTLSSNLLNSA